MADEVQAVLNFMRDHGLSTSQSALIQDVIDHRVESVEFEKFLFPMAPVPPVNVRPKATVCEEEEEEDEFVSLGSSTSGLCSSEFTNPYGNRTTAEVSSRSSSERLSQFGTARDYHDFDMQNDLWYNERDEDFAMPPHFDGSEPFVGPSEDKFIMTAETEKPIDNELGYKVMSDQCGSFVGSEDPWPLNVSSINELKGVGVTSYYNMKDNFIDREVEDVKLAASTVSNPQSTQRFDAKAVLTSNNNLEHKYYRGVNGGEATRSTHDADSAADAEEGTSEPLLFDTNDDEYEVFHLRVIHRKNRTGFEENKDLPVFLNSIIAGRYCVTEYLGSAAFSKVVQAQDLLTGVDVCLKIIKNNKEFFDQSLDEIKLLKFVNKHDPGDERHILRLYDYFYCQEHLFIVCELLRANLYEFQKHNQESGAEPYFTLGRIQLITKQCLEALEYLHYLGIIHCDLKPENILMKSYRRCEVKVIDLGSSCFQTDNLCLYVQSRSYRAPEVILGLPYDQRIDMWSLGCILVELCSGEVLFPNEELVMLLARMIGILGPIDAEMLVKGQETHKYFTEDYNLYLINEETNEIEYLNPEKSSLEHHLQVSDRGFINFVRDLLQINPQRRPTAREALEHPWLSHQYHL